MVKKAHFVTGKGGVGKSLVSASLATHFSLQKQHVLLAELNEYSFFKDFLQLNQISYKPSEWKNNLDICQWSPQDCLKEYALHLLKIESLYKLFFENPVSKSLIQVAPGLQELALLGKVTSSPRKHGPAMNYDTIVIDSFATGHFLSLLRAPSAMAEAIQFGPMGEQSRGIDSWIRNTDFTEIHIVSLAEELPMTESLELFLQLESEFNIRPKFYLNKLSGLVDADLKNLSAAAKNDLGLIIENENKAISLLRKNKIEFVKLPLVPTISPKTLVQKLSEALLD